MFLVATLVRGGGAHVGDGMVVIWGNGVAFFVFVVVMSIFCIVLVSILLGTTVFFVFLFNFFFFIF